MKNMFCDSVVMVFTLLLFSFLLSNCNSNDPNEPTNPVVPHLERWGIYSLDLTSELTELIYSSSNQISFVRLSNSGDKFIFSQKINGELNENKEICEIGTDGNGFRSITSNNYWDLYPCWSPDDERIAFLSFRETDLDIYVMNSTGSNETKLFDSGFHDADIDWHGDKIYFTSQSKIWSISEEGTVLSQITEPPRAGEWGNANLPFGDYDPRVNPDGTELVFERMVDDQSVHGNYNIYTINLNSGVETELTANGYSQGLVEWSHAGDKLVYIVAAIGTEGKYDIYMMNSNGSDNHSIMPSYFPAEFLCHLAMFSIDDTKIYFLGEWWE
ncbi:TolB family protein [Bacteroidota bacterium]